MLITSYISEHTAEYVLVPAMKAILEQKFSVVLPIFPWLTREFSNLAKSTHGLSSFRVLAMFPRRPKVFNEDIFVTVNSELSAFNKLAVKHGITAIAGCPSARNLRELASCRECVWLHIDQYYEYVENVNKLGRIRLSDKNIIEAVLNSTDHTMDSLEMFIRHTRDTLPVNFFGARYKPVYFLVCD
ncbi:hypothetical protein [Vibrio diazotrophicus]|uniref:hypothetical protein n=1 Tax=Vibrio diazotrophicus TaxID=685 RepID=UPI000C9EAF5F|nr:hypothetical protein [Vibrio diazotrophicus]PNH93079.1 hypothetical protein C1M59_07660 [Vibrio diazotrophicus]